MNKNVPLGLLLTEKEDGDHNRIYLTPVHVVSRKVAIESHEFVAPKSIDDFTLRNISWGRFDNGQHGALDDLTLSAYLSRDFQISKGFYGWSLAYRDVFSAELDRLESMVKTLRKITKTMQKMSDARGFPASFSEDVVRFAEAIGARWIIKKNEEDSRGAWNYDDAEYIYMTPAEGRACIDRIEYDWKKRHYPETTIEPSANMN